jgi:HEPN domain-containing protein
LQHFKGFLLAGRALHSTSCYEFWYWLQRLHRQACDSVTLNVWKTTGELYMPERHADWLRQSKRDLAHARHAAEDGDYEWSCFAAQQSAGKALKSVYQLLGAVAWGHSVTNLLTNLPEPYQPSEDLVERAKALDKHYIPARYPNGFDQGAPMDYYTLPEAERSIQDAGAILQFCEHILAGLAARDGETQSRRASDEGEPSGD